MGVVGRFVLAAGVMSSMAASILACWVGGVDFLLLVGQDVLRPGDVSLTVWSFSVLVGACTVAVTVGRHRLQLLERKGRSVLAGVVLAVTLVGTGVWCVGQVLVFEGLAALEPGAYTVLRASGIGRCALIAHESGRLRSSSGRIYAADGLGWATPVGSWDADEIQFPVRDGTCSLSWAGAVGTLSLRGSRAITPDRLQVVCPQ